jgi:hypothetical protein
MLAPQPQGYPHSGPDELVSVTGAKQDKPNSNAAGLEFIAELEAYLNLFELSGGARQPERLVERIAFGEGVG